MCTVTNACVLFSLFSFSFVAAKDDFKFLYPDDMPLEDKIRTVATEIYGAADIAVSSAAKTKLKKFTKMGYGHFPICVAKNQYSFSGKFMLKKTGQHDEKHSYR
jgi:formyltetrahydrofolate synthetase